MIDVATLFLAMAVAYAYLKPRSVDNKVKLAPVSTPKGKWERLIVTGLVVVMVACVASIFMGRYADGNLTWTMVIAPVVIGAAVVLIPLFLKGKK